MTAVIETKSASLDTMAVTIQALHVNGKQMTLAVFRQLPKIQVYGADGAMLPMVHWGIVRYHIKDEDCAIWVVASADGRLYRGEAHNHFRLGWCQRNLESVQAQLSALQASKPQDEEFFPYWRERAAQARASLERELQDARSNLVIAQRAAVTHAAVMALPQLFIAV